MEDENKTTELVMGRCGYNDCNGKVTKKDIITHHWFKGGYTFKCPACDMIFYLSKENVQHFVTYTEERLKLQENRENRVEREQEKTLEWYKAQAKELSDIRKIVFSWPRGIDVEFDEYFPDNVARKYKILEQWIADLQSGLHINCVYCGHRYPPGTPDVRDNVLYEHIKICPKHPLSKALVEYEQLQKDLWYFGRHLKCCPRRGNSIWTRGQACECGFDQATGSSKESKADGRMKDERSEIACGHIDEGRVRKGGLKPYPTSPKPDITPSGQKPTGH